MHASSSRPTECRNSPEYRLQLIVNDDKCPAVPAHSTPLAVPFQPAPGVLQTAPGLDRGSHRLATVSARLLPSANGRVDGGFRRPSPYWAGLWPLDAVLTELATADRPRHRPRLSSIPGFDRGSRRSSPASAGFSPSAAGPNRGFYTVRHRPWQASR